MSLSHCHQASAKLSILRRLPDPTVLDVERDMRTYSSSLDTIFLKVAFEAYPSDIKACIRVIVGKHARDIAEPQSCVDVCRSEYLEAWKGAMEKESNGLKANDTFTLADVPTGRKLLYAL